MSYDQAQGYKLRISHRTVDSRVSAALLRRSPLALGGKFIADWPASLQARRARLREVVMLSRSSSRSKLVMRSRGMATLCRQPLLVLIIILSAVCLFGERLLRRAPVRLCSCTVSRDTIYIDRVTIEGLITSGSNPQKVHFHIPTWEYSITVFQKLVMIYVFENFYLLIRCG